MAATSPVLPSPVHLYVKAAGAYTTEQPANAPEWTGLSGGVDDRLYVWDPPAGADDSAFSTQTDMGGVGAHGTYTGDGKHNQRHILQHFIVLYRHVLFCDAHRLCR